MSDPLADLDEAAIYRLKVMYAVINAVVEVGKIEGSDGGVIKLHPAREGICDAIAALENAVGASTNANDRRRAAELCFDRIVETGSELAKSVEEGKSMPWRFEAIGNPT